MLNEVISVLGRRLEERKESNKFESILKNIEKIIPEENIEWLYPEVPAIYSEIVRLAKEKQGKLSFHDALIALFVKNSGLRYITSFDTDFDGITGCERLKDEKDIR